MREGRIQYIWMVIWLTYIKLCNSTGKLSIQFLRFANNRKVNNGDCCDNLSWCLEECDIYFEICVTEVSQAKCNAAKFRTKVLGEGSFTFPGIGGDLGNGKKNPLEYSFQKWQGFSLTIEIWDFDSGFLKGSSDFVDNVHLDITSNPDQNSQLASSQAHKMKSKTSPSIRYLDLEIKIYCDDNYLVPDCARKCVPHDDAGGHYTCDYVNGRVVCNQYWYGDRCTQYCRPRNDAQGKYTCDNFGAKICAGNWFGGNCSTFCENTDDLSGHYKCDAMTGRKVCLPDWYGVHCLTFCKAQDLSDGHYSCNKTSGEKVCLGDWYGDKCTKYCSSQNDRLLGHFTCDVIGEKACLPGWHGVNCTQAMTALITSHNKLELWIDGVWYGPDNGQWQVAWSFQISTNATLIAVKAVDYGNKGGILGSLSSGLVTDEAWKCTKRFHSNWMTVTYDDSTWSRAKTYGYNGAQPWGKVAGIADNANWIWTDDNVNDDVVYCRRELTEIMPTALAKRSSSVQTSYETQTPLISSNNTRRTQFTTSHPKEPKSSVETRVQTPSSLVTVSSTMTSHWHHLGLTSTLHFKSVDMTSKYETTTSFKAVLTSLETLKHSPTTTYSLPTTKSNSKRYYITETLKTLNSISLSLPNTKTLPQNQETTRKTKQNKSVFSSIETPRPQQPSSTPISLPNHSTRRKAQSPLATTTHSRNPSGRQSNYRSTLQIESSTTKVREKETLAVSSSMSSKTHQSFSKSTTVSTTNIKLISQSTTLYQTTMVIYPSSLFVKETINTYRTKVAPRTKNIKSTTSSQSITTVEISGGIAKTTSPVSPTRSVVMTSSSVIEMDRIRRETFTFIVKLRDKWQDDTKLNIIQQIKDIYKKEDESNRFRVEEIGVKKRKECQNMVLLDIELAYIYENGLHKLPDLRRQIETLLLNKLDASEIIPQDSAQATLECGVSQSGRKVFSKDNFMLVFFPIVVFITAVGLGICIKMKQKKRMLTKVVPVNHLLSTHDKTDPSAGKISRIPHSHSQQELLQLNEFTSKET